jgi:hypothetical protein
MPAGEFVGTRLDPIDAAALRSAASLNGRSVAAELRAAAREHLAELAHQHDDAAEGDPRRVETATAVKEPDGATAA